MRINEIISENDLAPQRSSRPQTRPGPNLGSSSSPGVWDHEDTPTGPPRSTASTQGYDLLMRDGENAPGRGRLPSVALPHRFGGGTRTQPNPYVDTTPQRGLEHGQPIRPEGQPGAGMTNREFIDSQQSNLDYTMGDSIRTMRDPSTSPRDRAAAREIYSAINDLFPGQDI